MESSRNFRDLTLEDLKLFILNLSDQLQETDNLTHHSRLKTLMTNFIGYLKLLQENKNVASHGRSISQLIDSLIKDKVLTEDAAVFAKDINNNASSIKQALKADSEKTQYFFLFAKQQLTDLSPKESQKPTQPYSSFNMQDLYMSVTSMVILYQRQLAQTAVEDGNLLLAHAKEIEDPAKKNLLQRQAMIRYEEALSSIDSIPISYRNENDTLQKIDILISLNNLSLQLKLSDEAFKYCNMLLKILDDLHKDLEEILPKGDLGHSNIRRSMSTIKYNRFLKTSDPADLQISIKLLREIPEKTWEDYLEIVDRIDLLAKTSKDPKEQQNYHHSLLSILDSALEKLSDQTEMIQKKKEEYIYDYEFNLILREVEQLGEVGFTQYENGSFNLAVDALEQAYQLLKKADKELPKLYNIPYVINSRKEVIFEKLLESYDQLLMEYSASDAKKALYYINKMDELKADNPDVTLKLPAHLTVMRCQAHLQHASDIKDTDPMLAIQHLEMAQASANKLAHGPAKRMFISSIDEEMRELSARNVTGNDRNSPSLSPPRDSPALFQSAQQSQYIEGIKDSKQEESPRPRKK